MNFNILSDILLKKFRDEIKTSPIDLLDKIKKNDSPIDFFQFYKSVSSVYSSKIEGEDIDFDSYFKHKFLKVKFKPNYTRKADDLYLAYDFIDNNRLTFENVRKVHSILSKNLLPKSQQGLFRNNLMFVLNSDDNIEYVAAPPGIVKGEIQKLFNDIELLLDSRIDVFEIFYYAAFIHLTFVKIHPFLDGNGRSARLIEKWFLLEKIGKKASAIQLEKNYYLNLRNYYLNIKKLGLEYEKLDYKKALDFLLMTSKAIKKQANNTYLSYDGLE
ncbi:MAG: Fic family protein [Bacteroidota bacterium]|nr:Fic family protein [Bacteroidota bacterium]